MSRRSRRPSLRLGLLAVFFGLFPVACWPHGFRRALDALSSVIGPLTKRVTNHRTLVCLVVAAAVVAVSVAPAGAAPSEPFTGASARFDEAPQQAKTLNVGDWGVSEKRGAATYTIPLAVPPGRLGMEPHLALRYSSHSPLRGGIAAGWTLDLPSVAVDRSLGEETTPIFRASVGRANGRLVEVPEESPVGGKAYRIEFDDSFVRLFKRSSDVAGALTTWTALTPDGVRRDFGDEPDSRYLASGVDEASSRWLLTREADLHGNTVHYVWAREAIGPHIAFSLKRIEYTSNAAASLGPHAKVEFTYAPADLCSGSSRRSAPRPRAAQPSSTAHALSLRLRPWCGIGRARRGGSLGSSRSSIGWATRPFTIGFKWRILGRAAFHACRRCCGI
jgi:Salmonella virulence plasmid 65kDa B protein